MKNVNIKKGKEDIVEQKKKLSTYINKNALFLQCINDSYKAKRKQKQLQKYTVTKQTLYMKRNSNGNKYTGTFQYH